MANTEGWDPKTAFAPFIQANIAYWTPSVTFVEAAKDVVSAAKGLEMPYQDVIAAFKQVGIDVETVDGLDSDAIHEGIPEERFDNTVKTSSPGEINSIPTETKSFVFGNLTAHLGEWLYFKAYVHSQSYWSVSIEGEDGDADLYVSWKDFPNLEDYHFRPFLLGSDEHVQAPGLVGIWNVAIFAVIPFKGLKLTIQGASSAWKDVLLSSIPSVVNRFTLPDLPSFLPRPPPLPFLPVGL